MLNSYHWTAYGSAGESLPRDLHGFVHLTAAAWLAAPMDTGSAGPMTEEQAEELAEQARAGTREAEAAVAAWQAR